MKTKTKFLIKQSLAKKTNTKWFKVVNILLLVLLVAIVNIDSIINLFGGDFKNEKSIYVLDEVGVYPSFETYFNTIKDTVSDMANYTVENSTEEINALTKKLEEEHDDIVIYLTKSDTNYMEAKVYSYEPLDLVVRELINSSLNTIKSEYALATSNIDPEVLASISSPINIENIIANPESEDSEAKDIMSAGIIMIFLIPFFILIVLLTQMIGAEINDEKSTRGMEIIISNVSPEAHLFSKIISSTLFALIQLGLMLVYGGIALLIRYLINGSLTGSVIAGANLNKVVDMLKNSGMLGLIMKSLLPVVVLFILSFLIYALLASILASMTTSIEDYQQLQTPLMLILMAGYYLGIMASVFKGSLFIKIVSYIPFLSALVAPTLFWLGETTIIELWISVIILLASCLIIFKYGIRVYKVGILNYSSKDLWKKVFKSLKNKEEV